MTMPMEPPVDPAGRPILIAELCQNHLGDRGLLLDMVRAAAEAGADYVKIQALYSADLTRRERFETGLTDAAGRTVAIRRPHEAERERLSRLDLSPADEEAFVSACADAGVQPLVTVFTRAAVARLASAGFPAVKIASYDCASVPLLREVAERWNRIFLSTGSMFLPEIERAMAVLAGRSVALLHCVTIYPTPFEDLRLGRMRRLAALADEVGFSDHTGVARDGVWASKAALALGASVVERHFTILPPDRTKDGPVSIGPDDLRELRTFGDLPRVEQHRLLDDGRPGWSSVVEGDQEPSGVELLNRDYYAGRVASRVSGRAVFNWEDLDLGVLAQMPDLRDGHLPAATEA